MSSAPPLIGFFPFITFFSSARDTTGTLAGSLIGLVVFELGRAEGFTGYVLLILPVESIYTYILLIVSHAVLYPAGSAESTLLTTIY